MSDIRVEPGQVWIDNDPRKRFVRYVRVDVEAARRNLARALRLDEGLPMDYLIEQARGVWDHAAEFFAGRAEERSRARKAEARLDEIEAWLGAEESATHKLAGIRAIVEGVQR